MYSLYEYNQAGHMKVLKEEAFADGEKSGIAKGERRIIEAMIQNGKTPEKIADFCGLSIDEVMDIRNSGNMN